MSLKVWKTPTIDPHAGFTPMAADDWPEAVVDRWPMGMLRRTAMMAYDQLARDGELVPGHVRQESTGVVVVEYRSQIPAPWIHDLLARAERRITGA